MIKGRDNTAESLADVIELVRMRRQSGLLSVERIQASRFEEGEIYLQAGQPTYAHTGQLLGQEALLRMLSWRQVYFTFLADQPRPPVNIPSVLSANDNRPIAANSSRNSPASNPSLLNTNRNIPAVSPTSPRLPQVNLNGIPDEGSGRDPRYAGNTFDSNASIPGFEWLAPRNVQFICWSMDIGQSLIFLAVYVKVYQRWSDSSANYRSEAWSPSKNLCNSSGFLTSRG